MPTKMGVCAGVLAGIAASAAPITASGRAQERMPGIGGSVIPTNDGRLIDSLRRQHHAFPPEYGTVEPRMPPLGLTRGQLQVGNLVFELPKRAKPRTFRYALIGGDSGSWDLTR